MSIRPLRTRKKIVGVLMLVPDKLTLHFDDHEIVPVELPHDARLPIVRKRRKPVGEVDGFHRIPSMNNLGNGSSTEPSGSGG